MGYIREGKYTLEQVYDYLKSSKKTFNGKTVYKRSLRYKVFKDNHVCVNCGLEGEFYALERFHGSKLDICHFNLYAINKHGHEILMTKDHIIPSSKGGTDSLSNLQTMCTKCNARKGDKIEGEYKVTVEPAEPVINDFEITNEQVVALISILRDTINMENNDKILGLLSHSDRTKLYRQISSQHFKVGKRRVRKLMDELVRKRNKKILKLQDSK